MRTMMAMGLTAATVMAACGTSTSPSSIPSTSTAATASAPPVSTVTRTVTVTSTPPPTAAPAATASTPTAADVEAVAHRIFPGDATNGYGECDRGDDLSSCPVTPRLSARLLQHPTSGPVGGAAPFCRCQNTSPDLAITVDVAPGAGVAHVALFGASVRIDLSMITVSGRLVVDDTTCTGREAASTSIYAASVPPCAS